MYGDYDYHKRVAELHQLAFIDESEPYEVDRVGIYYDEQADKFSLITASGCSCWDGDYSEEQFVTFDDLKRSLIQGRNQRHPSLAGAIELADTAEESLQFINRKPTVH